MQPKFVSNIQIVLFFSICLTSWMIKLYNMVLQTLKLFIHGSLIPYL